MEKIKVACQHFWPGFNFDHSIFIAALKQVYEVEIIDKVEKADLVFESHFKSRTFRDRAERKLKKMRGLKITGKRVFFSAEPYSIPVGQCHGVISYNLNLSDHHFRLPHWVLFCVLWKEETGGRMKPDPDSNFLPKQLTSVRLTKPDKFACTVFGNVQHLRFKAAQWLERFGKVDIYGKSVGRPIHSKIEIMPEYKFNLCFENTILPGYLTEKALHAKMGGCIPLYWGDPAYRVDFNPKSLINIYEYDCDFQRIFDTVDLEEVRHTPLMDKVPTHILPDMARYLEGVMKAPASSLF